MLSSLEACKHRKDLVRHVRVRITGSQNKLMTDKINEFQLFVSPSNN